MALVFGNFTGRQCVSFTEERDSRHSSSYSGFTWRYSININNESQKRINRHKREMLTSSLSSTDLCSQVVASGQVFEAEQAVPVTSSPTAWIMLNNLRSEIRETFPQHCHTDQKTTMKPKTSMLLIKLQSKCFLLTSISHRALLLVAEVADCLPVVRRKTYCFFLWSSHVRNFSCSAWNNRTTSPWEGKKKNSF